MNTLTHKYSQVMNIFMNTLNLSQKGHLRVKFARSSVKTGKVPHPKRLCRRSSSHMYLLNDVGVELFCEKDELGGFSMLQTSKMVKRWCKKGSKRGARMALRRGHSGPLLGPLLAGVPGLG